MSVILGVSSEVRKPPPLLRRLSIDCFSSRGVLTRSEGRDYSFVPYFYGF